MNQMRKTLILLIAVVMCIFLFTGDYSFAKKKKKGPIEIDVQVRDGFHIISQLNIPPKTTIKNKVPVVVFLHSIGVDSSEWGNLPVSVKENLKVATLNINMRGHGKSILNKNNKKVYWTYFSEKSYQKFPYDVIDVLKYLKENYPEIDTSRIVLIGSGLGANISVMVGSSGVNAKTIVMLSPMIKYKGFDIRLPIVKYGKHPLLFMVSKKDTYSYQSCIELMKFAQGKKMLKTYPYGGTGVNLIKFHADAKPFIINWIKDSLFPQQKKETKLK